jgi:hypothetical protein
MGKSIFGIFIGTLLIIAPRQETLSQNTVGIIVIIISLLYLISGTKLWWDIKHIKRPEKFRSKDEEFIADYFDRKNIKCIYEKEIKLGKRKIKPDFYLPEFDVYVEYWGMWNSSRAYNEECEDKRNNFKKEDLKLVELYPDNLIDSKTLDWKFTKRLLEVLKRK